MNLTNQVRSIAEVTKAVAQGDLSKKIEVDVCGEIMELKVCVGRKVLRVKGSDMALHLGNCEWYDGEFECVCGRGN